MYMVGQKVSASWEMQSLVLKISSYFTHVEYKNEKFAFLIDIVCITSIDVKMY